MNRVLIFGAILIIGFSFLAFLIYPDIKEGIEAKVILNCVSKISYLGDSQISLCVDKMERMGFDEYEEGQHRKEFYNILKKIDDANSGGSE